MFRFPLLFALALAALHPAPSFAMGTADAFFAPSFNNMGEELALARDAKKLLVIMYEQEGCPFCWKMRRDVLSRKEVQDYYKERFHAIPMDIRGALDTVDFTGKAMTQKDFSIQQNVRLTPVFIYYDETGKELHRLIGFYDREEFLLAGDFVLSGAYKTEDFFLWLKKKKAGKAVGQ
ncbi:MAG: thioredoxin fold domain-containing protein [Nitrospinae bacterium]|nr:thioredoxin fold domain-containing protein [Nitrospinota bacterium]